MSEEPVDQTEAAAEVEADAVEVGRPKPRIKHRPDPQPVDVQDPDPALEVAGEPEPHESAPAAEPESQPQSAPEPSEPAVYQAAVTGDRDDVYLDKCIVKNLHSKKSLTVHHLQRRLWELGFTSAADDKDGYYSDLTIDAVAAFQAANDLEETGIVDEETFKAIFNGDPIVVIHV